MTCKVTETHKFWEQCEGGQKSKLVASRNGRLLLSGKKRQEPIKCSRLGLSTNSGFFSSLLPCGDIDLSCSTRTSNHPLPSLPTQSIADHVGQIQPAIRAPRRRCSQHRNPPVHGTQPLQKHVYTSNRCRISNCPLNHAELTSQFFQRAASSSSGAESSQWATTATASAATAFAVGSAAWYYYQFGRDAHAMTPAEEGYVAHRLHTHSTTQR